MVDIARAMGRTLSSLGPARANIISKGMIYSTDQECLDFSMPLFAEFMREKIDQMAVDTRSKTLKYIDFNV